MTVPASLDRSPLHAKYYADSATYQTTRLIQQVPLARDTFRIRLEAPTVAAALEPGQFLMLRIAGLQDPLLGRPLALYDTVDDLTGQPWAIDIVYLVTGKMTRALSQLVPGQQLELWGPLGNTFPWPQWEHLILVAGGIGQTPFLAVGREATGQRAYGRRPRMSPERAPRVTICYGARSADHLAGLDAFLSAGMDVRLATDDGSEGHAGLVTEILERVLAEDVTSPRPGSRAVYCCGPERMMARVAEQCLAAGVPCWVSLEAPMACGIGACYTCVAPVWVNPEAPEGAGPAGEHAAWDYKRTCVEGPIFQSHRVAWDRM